MNFKFSSITLIFLLLISCAKKNGSSTPLLDQTSKKSPDDSIQAQREVLPKHTYTLKTQTEEFYIPRDTKNLKIVVTPLFKNIARRENFKHMTRLTVLDIRWAITTQAESCEVIENRIVEFSVVKESKPLNYREINLTVDDKKINFSPEENFQEHLDKSIFRISLPESRGDYFLKLATLNHRVPRQSTYTKEECDRIIFERPNRSFPMDVSSKPAKEALWSSYRVEVFYDLKSE